MKRDLEQLIDVRPAYENDRAFILATWLRGLYYGNSWFKEIQKDVFMQVYHGVIDNVLKSEHTIINVAVLNEDPDIILGYSVLNNQHLNPVLHWVIVKEAWRKMGIARHIIPENVDTVTQLTTIGLKLKPENVKFNPFLI